MQGWVAAKVFELGASQAPDPTTSAGLLEGLGGINGDVLPDLTGPLAFNRGAPATPTVCSFGVQIVDGEFEPAYDGRRVCAEFDPNL
jgi:hypothetical protein